MSTEFEPLKNFNLQFPVSFALFRRLLYVSIDNDWIRTSDHLGRKQPQQSTLHASIKLKMSLGTTGIRPYNVFKYVGNASKGTELNWN